MKPHFGIAGNIPTMEFVTRYMNSTIPAHPNSATQVESGALQTPFHRRASMRWLAPIVKHSSIMWW